MPVNEAAQTQFKAFSSVEPVGARSKELSGNHYDALQSHPAPVSKNKEQGLS